MPPRPLVHPWPDRQSYGSPMERIWDWFQPNHGGSAARREPRLSLRAVRPVFGRVRRTGGLELFGLWGCTPRTHTRFWGPTKNKRHQQGHPKGSKRWRDPDCLDATLPKVLPSTSLFNSFTNVHFSAGHALFKPCNFLGPMSFVSWRLTSLTRNFPETELSTESTSTCERNRQNETNLVLLLLVQVTNCLLLLPPICLYFLSLLPRGGPAWVGLAGLFLKSTN